MKLIQACSTAAALVLSSSISMGQAHATPIRPLLISEVFYDRAGRPSFSSLMPKAMVSGQIASVPINPVGPCCSVEPMGIIMPDERFR